MTPDPIPSVRTLARLGEFGLIAEFSRCAGKSACLRIGIGDDAAVLSLPKAHELLVSADLLIEDVHFRRRTFSPRQVGEKSVAVNMSDLAAMGASPLGLVLSLALPKDLPLSWVRGFRDGFLGEAARYGVPLIGGDTTKSPGPIVVNVTVLGCARPAEILTRGGARPGDRLWLCGDLGLSRTGLDVMESGARGFATARRAHRQPRAWIEEGRVLARSGRCTSCIDVSDGLLGDLAHVAQASGVSFELDLDALPAPPDVLRWARKTGQNPLDYLLNGGEDYALLFTLSDARPAPGARRKPDLWRPIGRAVPGKSITLVHPDGRREAAGAGGFRHF